MFPRLGAVFRHAARGLPAGRLLLLAAVLAVPTGCATSDADLDYTRQPSPDTTSSGDTSFHGWNNVNYDKQQ
jgi:hypothetical protein